MRFLLIISHILLIPSSLAADRAGMDIAGLPRDTVLTADTAAVRTDTVMIAAAAADDEEPADTTVKTRRNLADGFNALRYVMERRYLNVGEDFTDRWDDHLFLEGGVGFEQMVPPGDNYHFNSLTSARLGVGKQFDRLHTLRLTVHGDFGYQQDKDLLFLKFGGRIDHLFSFSSYFCGYNPSRLLEVSSVAGVGVQYSELRGRDVSGLSFEGHLGLQLQFYTGPQGYVSLEPYVGIATDKSDLSGDRNWRKYDLFYGAGIGYVYYLRNNLSSQSRSRLIADRREAGWTPADTVLPSWRNPWFVEFAGGLDFLDSPELSFVGTLGSELTVSVGKWLSPVLGVRLSASASTAACGEIRRPASGETGSYRPEYTKTVNSVYAGGRFEALFNPLGFCRSFSWDSPFGFYTFGGGELGRMFKYYEERLSCTSEAYTCGAHFWARLSSGLQVFVEPRFTHYIYKIPYTNVNWNRRFSDNGLSVSLGLTVNTLGVDAGGTQAGGGGRTKDGRFIAGAGGGTSLRQTKSSFSGSGMGYNAQIWGEYRLDNISAVRASFDFVSLPGTGMADFYDYSMAHPEAGYARTEREGLWNHRYYLGIVSLGYSVSLTDAVCGRSAGRMFGLNAFAGPSLVMLFGETSSLHPGERLQQGHECRLVGEPASGTFLGANAGLRLSAGVSRRLSLYLSPEIFVLGGADLPGIDFLKIRYIGTLSLGAQYNF